MLFEKRPDTAEAIQWDGHNWNGRHPVWLKNLYRKAYEEGEYAGWLGFSILEDEDGGDICALYSESTKNVSLIHKNDWLIYEPDSEIFYVYDDETFNRKFKRVGL